MTAKECAKMIDISAVRTHHGKSDILELVECAREFGFINVHVLPNWVKLLAELLRDIEGVYVGAPCGFPSGAHTTQAKILEAEQLIVDGVEEMDIVMNVGRFIQGEYDYVTNELKQIIHLVKNAGRPIMTKVLIELNCLNDDQMKRACEMVAETGADFLKTGTGWVPGNANIERIAKIKDYLRGTGVKVKAAGGIRTKEEFLTLLDLGVERFGINTQSAMEIVNSFH